MGGMGGGSNGFQDPNAGFGQGQGQGFQDPNAGFGQGQGQGQGFQDPNAGFGQGGQFGGNGAATGTDPVSTLNNISQQITSLISTLQQNGGASGAGGASGSGGYPIAGGPGTTTPNYQSGAGGQQQQQPQSVGANGCLGGVCGSVSWKKRGTHGEGKKGNNNKGGEKKKEKGRRKLRRL